jgi:hypothetical protein
MRIAEPGHVYDLNHIDAHELYERLTFVNREPGTEHSGTQTQEVLRALIDRTMHCDNCLRWEGNDLIIYHLRMALVLHEARALIRKVEKGIIQPENIVTNREDGHFAIRTKSEDAMAPPPSVDNHRYTIKPKPDSPLVPKMPDFCATSAKK